MDNSGLPTDFIIAAQIRVAALENIPIVVRRHGDNNSGTIILKVNLLNGTSRVLTQTRMNEALVWMPVSRTDLMSEAEAENYLERQSKIDPDSWLIEIEDRQGRHWFPGKIITALR